VRQWPKEVIEEVVCWIRGWRTHDFQLRGNFTQEASALLRALDDHGIIKEPDKPKQIWRCDSCKVTCEIEPPAKARAHGPGCELKAWTVYQEATKDEQE